MWMRHSEHGGYADLPDIPYWHGHGWEPADGPPPEPDLTKDPLPEPPETTEALEKPSRASSYPTDERELDQHEES